MLSVLICTMCTCVSIIIMYGSQFLLKDRPRCKSYHCAECIFTNIRLHELCWNGWEMGAGIISWKFCLTALDKNLQICKTKSRLKNLCSSFMQRPKIVSLCNRSIITIHHTHLIGVIIDDEPIIDIKWEIDTHFSPPSKKLLLLLCIWIRQFSDQTDSESTADCIEVTLTSRCNTVPTVVVCIVSVHKAKLVWFSDT